MAFISKDQVRQLIQNAPQGTDPHEIVQHLIDTGNEVEGLNNHPSFMQQAGEFAKGVIKGAGRTITGTIDLAQNLQNINPVNILAEKIIPGMKNINEKTKQIVDSGLEKVNKKLEPSNIAQKLGGYAETAAEVLIPGTKISQAIKEGGAAIKSLELSNLELKQLGGKALQYLDKKAIRQAPLEVKNFIGEKTPQMVQKVTDLASEFKDVLTNQDPQKNLENIINLGKNYKKMTLDMIKNHEIPMSIDSVKQGFKDALKKDTSIIFGSDKKEITNKSLQGYANEVEKLLNKGKDLTNTTLEEARINWRAGNKNLQGNLSKTNELLHNVIKKVIKNTLPEEKRVIYDAYKQKMAKMFDIQTILEAKKAAQQGTKTITGKTAALIGKTLVPVAAWEAGKKLIGK